LEKTLKRLFDILAASLVLVLACPLLLFAATAIAISLGRPVLFRQLRPGLREKTFALFKFRTMNDRVGPDGELLPDEQRITKSGRWIRALSLDEFPQLINVIKGDMSLVGPRPLLMEYLPLYSPEQHRRHDVRPGITGWAQVNGRNSLTWEDKFKLDVWYVDHQSFTLDLRILWLTVLCVISRKGVAAHGHVTMSKFAPGKTPHGM
jgi:sugar transferase EpsL